MIGIALSCQRVYPLAFTSTTLLPNDSVMFFILFYFFIFFGWGEEKVRGVFWGSDFLFFLLLNFNLVKVHVFFF